MDRNDNLTILLLLKDRAPFTWRWMSYCNQIRLPFKVLIADGGKDRSVEKLADKSIFPNMDYEYIRYPYDKDYNTFFKKIYEALTRVKTKYVVLVSNDDFYFTDALINSVNFLDTHPDYSAARGDIYNFTVKQSKKIKGDKDVYGSITNIYKLYLNTSNTAPTAMERIRIFSQYSNSLWGDVCKTDELKEFYKILCELKIDNFIFADHLISALTVAKGKIYRESVLYMLHQYQPDSLSFALENNPFEWISSESWSLNFSKLADTIGRQVAHIDNIEMENARHKFIQYYLSNVLGKNMIEGYVTKRVKNSSFKILNLSHVFGKDNIIRKVLKNLYLSIKSWGQNIKSKKELQRLSYYKKIEMVRDFLIKNAPRQTRGITK